MKLKLLLRETGRTVGRVFSPAFWRRKVSLRARRNTVSARLPQDGLLRDDVLREMLKRGDEARHEHERKTDQV